MAAEENSNLRVKRRFLMIRPVIKESSDESECAFIVIDLIYFYF